MVEGKGIINAVLLAARTYFYGFPVGIDSLLPLLVFIGFFPLKGSW